MRCGACGRAVAEGAVGCPSCHAKYRKTGGYQSITGLAAGIFAGLALSIPFNQPACLAVGAAVGVILFVRLRVFAWVRD